MRTSPRVSVCLLPATLLLLVTASMAARADILINTSFYQIGGGTLSDVLWFDVRASTLAAKGAHLQAASASLSSVVYTARTLTVDASNVEAAELDDESSSGLLLPPYFFTLTQSDVLATITFKGSFPVGSTISVSQISFGFQPTLISATPRSLIFVNLTLVGNSLVEILACAVSVVQDVGSGNLLAGFVVFQNNFTLGGMSQFRMESVTLNVTLSGSSDAGYWGATLLESAQDDGSWNIFNQSHMSMASCKVYASFLINATSSTESLIAQGVLATFAHRATSLAQGSSFSIVGSHLQVETISVPEGAPPPYVLVFGIYATPYHLKLCASLCAPGTDLLSNPSLWSFENNTVVASPIHATRSTIFRVVFFSDFSISAWQGSTVRISGNRVLSNVTLGMASNNVNLLLTNNGTLKMNVSESSQTMFEIANNTVEVVFHSAPSWGVSPIAPYQEPFQAVAVIFQATSVHGAASPSSYSPNGNGTGLLTILDNIVTIDSTRLKAPKGSTGLVQFHLAAIGLSSTSARNGDGDGDDTTLLRIDNNSLTVRATSPTTRCLFLFFSDTSMDISRGKMSVGDNSYRWESTTSEGLSTEKEFFSGSNFSLTLAANSHVSLSGNRMNVTWVSPIAARTSVEGGAYLIYFVPAKAPPYSQLVITESSSLVVRQTILDFRASNFPVTNATTVILCLFGQKVRVESNSQLNVIDNDLRFESDNVGTIEVGLLKLLEVFTVQSGGSLEVGQNRLTSTCVDATSLSGYIARCQNTLFLNATAKEDNIPNLKNTTFLVRDNTAWFSVPFEELPLVTVSTSRTLIVVYLGAASLESGASLLVENNYLTDVPSRIPTQVAALLPLRVWGTRLASVVDVTMAMVVMGSYLLVLNNSIATSATTARLFFLGLTAAFSFDGASQFELSGNTLSVIPDTWMCPSQSVCTYYYHLWYLDQASRLAATEGASMTVAGNNLTVTTTFPTDDPQSPLPLSTRLSGLNFEVGGLRQKSSPYVKQMFYIYSNFTFQGNTIRSTAKFAGLNVTLTNRIVHSLFEIDDSDVIVTGSLHVVSNHVRCLSMIVSDQGEATPFQTGFRADQIVQSNGVVITNRWKRSGVGVTGIVNVSNNEIVFNITEAAILGGVQVSEGVNASRALFSDAALVRLLPKSYLQGAAVMVHGNTFRFAGWCGWCYGIGLANVALSAPSTTAFIEATSNTIIFVSLGLSMTKKGPSVYGIELRNLGAGSVAGSFPYINVSANTINISLTATPQEEDHQPRRDATYDWELFAVSVSTSAVGESSSNSVPMLIGGNAFLLAVSQSTYLMMDTSLVKIAVYLPGADQDAKDPSGASTFVTNNRALTINLAGQTAVTFLTAKVLLDSRSSGGQVMVSQNQLLLLSTTAQADRPASFMASDLLLLDGPTTAVKPSAHALFIVCGNYMNGETGSSLGTRPQISPQLEPYASLKQCTSTTTISPSGASRTTTATLIATASRASTTLSPSATTSTTLTRSRTYPSQSESATETMTTSDSVTGTGATESLCEFTRADFIPLCSIFPDIAQSAATPTWSDTNADPFPPCSTLNEVTETSESNATTSSLPPGLRIRIPYSDWSGNRRPIGLYIRVASGLGGAVVPRGPVDSSNVSDATHFLPPTPATLGDRGSMACAVASATKGSHSLLEVGSSAAYVRLEVTYEGVPTLTQVDDVVHFATHSVIRCPVNTTGGPVPILYADEGALGPRYPLRASVLVSVRIILESAGPPPVALDPTVDAGSVVGAVGGIVSGVPSSLIRGGMASSLRSMLRCEEFEPTDGVDMMNNPPEWALGDELLQYQRGSVVLGGCILLFGVAGAMASVAAIKLKHRGSSTPLSVGEALKMTRMPSLVLPLVLLAGEVSTGSIASLLLYFPSQPLPTNEDSPMPRGAVVVAVDVVLCVLVAAPVWAYLIYYAYSTTLGCQVRTQAAPEDSEDLGSTSSGPLLRDVELSSLSDDGDNDTTVPSVAKSDEDVIDEEVDDSTHRLPSAKHRCGARIVQYLLESTHEAVPHGESGSPVEWVRGHYYFVAERAWIPYGAVEAVAGGLVNFLEGVPLTSRSLAICASRPAAMAILLLILTVFLVVKRPISIRLQQWVVLATTALLLLASALITANVMVASLELEAAASYVLMITSIITAVTSVLDVVLWVLLLIPSLRVQLGLRPRSLGALLHRVRMRSPATRHDVVEIDPATRYPLHTAVGDTNIDAEDSAVAEQFERIAAQVLLHRLKKTYGQRPPPI